MNNKEVEHDKRNWNPHFSLKINMSFLCPRWAGTNPQQDKQSICYPFWMLLEFNGTLTPFADPNVPFHNGARLHGPGGIPITLISLMAIHRNPAEYFFLGVIEGTTTFILLENHPSPLSLPEAAV